MYVDQFIMIASSGNDKVQTLRHEWGREGSGDCGIRVVIAESGVSKSSRHGAKRRGGLYCVKTAVPFVDD